MELNNPTVIWIVMRLLHGAHCFAGFKNEIAATLSLGVIFRVFTALVLTRVIFDYLIVHNKPLSI
jgi:hypothetical protein